MLPERSRDELHRCIVRSCARQFAGRTKTSVTAMINTRRPKELVAELCSDANTSDQLQNNTAGIKACNIYTPGDDENSATHTNRVKLKNSLYGLERCIEAAVKSSDKPKTRVLNKNCSRT